MSTVCLQAAVAAAQEEDEELEVESREARGGSEEGEGEAKKRKIDPARLREESEEWACQAQVPKPAKTS